MTYKDQSVYNGSWKDDKRDGEGTMKWNNGTIYKG